jgi:hypothetical protein
MSLSSLVGVLLLSSVLDLPDWGCGIYTGPCKIINCTSDGTSHIGCEQRVGESVTAIIIFNGPDSSASYSDSFIPTCREKIDLPGKYPTADHFQGSSGSHGVAGYGSWTIDATYVDSLKSLSGIATEDGACDAFGGHSYSCAFEGLPQFIG